MTRKEHSAWHTALWLCANLARDAKTPEAQDWANRVYLRLLEAYHREVLNRRVIGAPSAQSR